MFPGSSDDGPSCANRLHPDQHPPSMSARTVKAVKTCVEAPVAQGIAYQGHQGVVTVMRRGANLRLSRGLTGDTGEATSFSVGDVSDIAALDGELFVGYRRGEIAAYPTSRAAMSGEWSARSVSAGGTYQGDDIPRLVGLWAGDGWLVKAVVTLDGYIWFAQRPDGSSGQVAARGDLVGCGNPIIDGRLVGVDSGGEAVVGLGLGGETSDWRIPGPSLTTTHCVAGNRHVIVVTGQVKGVPAVAIHDSSGWEILKFPGVDSILEPRVSGAQVIISAPEEAFLEAGESERVKAAGAVYVLERGPSARGWQVMLKVLPAVARPFGLLGFNVVVDNGKLYVNYLDGARTPTSFGEPRVCTVDLE